MGVECLIRLFDGPAGRSRGDIVSVKESPAKWGKGEGLPNYTILKIPDVDISTMKLLYHKRHKPVAWDVGGNEIEWVRSWHKLNINTLSGDTKTAIEANEKPEIKYKNIDSILVDRTK